MPADPIYSHIIPAVRHEFIDWNNKAGITSFHFYDREPAKTHLYKELATVAARFRGRRIRITYTESVPHTDPIKEQLLGNPDAYQAIANQHCIYYARKRSTWVWLADLDEYIVPLALMGNQTRVDVDARLGFFKDRLATVNSRYPNLYAVTIPGTPFVNENPLPTDFNGNLQNFKLRPAEGFAYKCDIAGRKTVSRSDLLERAWVHNAYGCQGVVSGPARDQPQKAECMELCAADREIFLNAVGELPLSMVHFVKDKPRKFSYHGGPVTHLTWQEDGLLDLNSNLDRERGDHSAV